MKLKVSKKILGALTATMFLSLAAGFVGCDYNGDGTDVRVPAIVVDIEKETCTLDVGEAECLNVKVENSEESVIWGSSDPSVATVDANGIVTGIRVGEAIITAKIGSKTDTCKVTVIDSQTTPVLVVSDEGVSVSKTENYTVEVSAEWKGEVLQDSITYTWALQGGAPTDVASIETADNGAKATFTGVNYGATTYVVSATVKGVNVVKTVYVNVCDSNVSIRIDNMTSEYGKYVANIPLVATDDATPTLTPSVQIKVDGVAVADTLTWESADPSIVAVEGGNLVAKKEGETLLVAHYNESSVSVLARAYRPELNVDYTFAIETSRLEHIVVPTDQFEGTIKTFSVQELDVHFIPDGNILRFDEAKIPRRVSSMGDRDATLVTDKATYHVELGIYTMFIRDAEDLDSFGTVAKEQCAEANYWDGYFALANNIDYNKKYTSFITKNSFTSGNPKHGNAGGFRGVFDGRGYNIDGFVLADGQVGGGLLGVTVAGSIVKDLSFTNAKVLCPSGLINSFGAGTIQNVYVHCIEQRGGTDGENASGFFFASDCSPYNFSTYVINCFVETDTSNGGSYDFGLGTTWEGVGIVRECYSVGAASGFALQEPVVLGALMNVSDSYATHRELLETGIDFDHWVGNFWTVINGYPYPKNIADTFFPEGEMPNAEQESELAFIGEEIVLLNLGKYDQIVLGENTPYGIKTAGNKILVDRTVEPGTKFTYSVRSVRDWSLVQEFAEVTLLGNEPISGDIKDVILNNGTDFVTVELPLPSNVTGSVAFAKLGDKILNGGEMEGQTFKVPASEIPQTMFGELPLNVAVLSEETYYTVEMPALVVTKVIKTAEDMNSWYAFAVQAGANAIDNLNGYFVLENDITFTEEVPFNSPLSFADIEGGDKYGLNIATTHFGSILFKGTFDGRGHTISDLTITEEQGSVFGPGMKGVIKNINFINAKVKAQASFLTVNAGGTMENLYIHITEYDAPATDINPASPGRNVVGITNGYIQNGGSGYRRLRNVFVDLACGDAHMEGNVNWAGAGPIGFAGNGYVVNFYAIGIANADPSHTKVYISGYDSKFKQFADLASFKATVTVSEENGWDMNYWTVDEDGKPIPKSLA